MDSCNTNEYECKKDGFHISQISNSLVTISSKYDLNRIASNANDGNYNSMTVTKEEKVVWLKFDMLQTVIVNSIKIVNRGNPYAYRITLFKLYVGEYDETDMDSNNLYYNTLSRLPQNTYRNVSQIFRGRYVFLYHNDNTLALLNIYEIEVFQLLF